MTDLQKILRERVRGEVHLDRKHRILYATDASIYQQEPVGVVCPMDAEDALAALEVAAGAGVPVLPRGAGTSLAGQTTAEGALVLDFSRHMDRVLRLDRHAMTVQVQPGIILDHLNAQLADHGLMFGPDVAPSNRATLGGMTGNNSCGARSIRYDKAGDNLEAAEVALPEGEFLHLGSRPREEARGLARGDDAEGRIYREALRIAGSCAEEIRSRFPDIPRRVSGYNLDRLLPPPGGGDPPLNLSGLLAGSEGTLGVALSLTLRLVETPPSRALAVVRFPGLIEALRAAPWIRPFRPAALEVLDHWLLGLAAASPGYASGLDFLEGDPGAVLMVEFFGDETGEAASQLEDFVAEASRQGIGQGIQTLTGRVGQQAAWAVRKAGLGLLMSMKGDAKPVAFVEDTAVPPDRLADYMEEFLALTDGEGVRCAVYGHAGAGCLHTRPILSLKERAGRDAMVRISEGVADLVARYGGCMSGEHGDGLSRSRYLERQFGPVLMDAFRRVKAAFDPRGRMNPGKITASPPVDGSLRVAAGERSRTPRTVHRFAAEGGMVRAVELCSGVGVCRQRGSGAMCPSYMATREEEHATRGRANLLRAALEGRLPGGLASAEVAEALSLCLECKACKTECPTQVDMARLKAETLHQARGGRRPALADRLFSRMDQYASLASAVPGPANWTASLSLARKLLERVAGIDRRRPLPGLARETFSRWWKRRAPDGGDPGRLPVALFVDTFTEYFQPEVGAAAVAALEEGGYRVLDAGLSCCGRVCISRGVMDEARNLAHENLPVLARWASRGVPVVGLEPSCVLTLRDDLPELVASREAPDAVANVYLFEELLARDGSLPDPVRRSSGKGRRYFLHTHCHQRSLVGPGVTLDLLGALGGEAIESGAGCCGMAGSFGFQHYDLSLAVARDRLLPALERMAEGTTVVAPGISCRWQIGHLAGFRAIHPAQAVLEVLEAV